MRKYKILIVQLTRIGDIIQTYQAASQTLQQRDDVEFHLICRKSFGKPLDFMLSNVFNKITYINTEMFLNKDTKNLKETQANTIDFIQKQNEQKYDLVVNLSFNKSSSYLTTMIKATAKMGIKRNLLNQVVIEDQWSQYVYSNVMDSTTSGFNLVDIYKTMLGSKELYLTDYQAPDSNIITIHPFASSKKKSFNAQKWSEVIYNILKQNENTKINLVGAKSDKAEAEKIVNNESLEIYNSRISIVTDQSIEHTFNLLADSCMFIGHDSMVSHLASMFRIPSLVVSLGSVRPQETSPYNDRAVILSPKNNCFPCSASFKCEDVVCHKSIFTNSISKIALNMLNKIDLTDDTTTFELENLDIYKVHIDGFGLRLKSQTEHYTKPDDFLIAVNRLVFSYYFTGQELEADTPRFSDKSVRQLRHAQTGVNYSLELANFAFTYCNTLIKETEKKKPNEDEVKTLLSKLNEVDDLFKVTISNYPSLGPIINYFYTSRLNSAGNNLVEVSQNHLVNYYDLINILTIYDDLIKKSIGPKIVKNKGTEV